MARLHLTNFSWTVRVENQRPIQEVRVRVSSVSSWDQTHRTEKLGAAKGDEAQTVKIRWSRSLE